jgi:phosphatidylserine synthase
MGNGSNRRGADEVFCTQCGSTIKKQAEICPNCGVVNDQSGSNTQTSTGGYIKEPSGNWITGVKISIGLWVVVGILLASISRTIGGGMGQLAQGAALSFFLSIIQLIGWVVVSMSMYKDVEYVRYHTDNWPLNGTLYIAGAVILPIFTQILGVVGFVIPGGIVLSLVIPLTIVAMCVRHVRTRSEVLPAGAT